jgi:predicted RNase H-like HicB family nuclease
MSGFYNVLFREEPEGGFTAIVPTLPGCVTYGRTLEEAKRMVLDAIELYLYSLKKHGEKVPSDDDTFFAPVRLRPRTPLSRKRKAYAA